MIDDEDVADEVELPPATVEVRHRQTGGSMMAVVLISMGLVPFVQAVVAAFGTKFADAVDARTRRAVRRLLRRVHEPPEVPGTFDRVRVSVSLNDDDTGARILLDDDLPAEAVAQLMRLTAAQPAVAGGSVIWHPKGVTGGHWYVESEGRLRTMWNHDLRQWDTVPSGTT